MILAAPTGPVQGPISRIRVLPGDRNHFIPPMLASSRSFPGISGHEPALGPSAKRDNLSRLHVGASGRRGNRVVPALFWGTRRWNMNVAGAPGSRSKGTTCSRSFKLTTDECRCWWRMSPCMDWASSRSTSQSRNCRSERPCGMSPRFAKWADESRSPST